MSTGPVCYGLIRKKGNSMDGFTGALTILGLFVLRIGVPLLITIGIGYVLLRLDARWQAEAEAGKQPRQRPVKVQAKSRSPRGYPATAVPTIQPTAISVMAGLPCWSLKGCSEAMRADCAAGHQPDVPCWTARQGAEGRMPPECSNCDLYTQYAPVWAERQVIH
ncbi:MAG: hypothetical protein U9R25_10680 [Chloroflexota bacterium]|nr:hypothetical protein [Chloroflexota bacterium]